MSFFDNENKEFNTKNILPIIGATIGVVLTLGAAGVALSPLLSVKIAGYAAGFASALGLTTLGAGLVFGAIFAIVAAVSISQILANKAMAKAQASINAQAEDIKKVEDSIEAQAEDIKKVETSAEKKIDAVKASIEAQAENIKKVEASVEAQAKKALEEAIIAADIPSQAKEKVGEAITEQNLVIQTTLNNALDQKADKSELKDFAAKADVEELTNRVNGHDTALGEKASKGDLITLTTVLDNGRVEDVKKALGLNQG